MDFSAPAGRVKCGRCPNFEDFLIAKLCHLVVERKQFTTCRKPLHCLTLRCSTSQKPLFPVRFQSFSLFHHRIERALRCPGVGNLYYFSRPVQPWWGNNTIFLYSQII